MQKKVNVTKPAIVLIISVILAVSVCFCAVYAWFLENSTAKATISGEVLSFYFTANGKFNEQVTFSEAENNFTYEKSPNGMFPGQKIMATLTLSNENSNVDAIYKISIKNSNENHYPKDCLITVKSVDNDEGYSRNTFSQSEIVYPVSSNTDKYQSDPSYALLRAGQKKVIKVTIEWPFSYGDIPSGASEYKNADQKNAGDMDFMSLSKENSKTFALVLDVVAEQIPQ